jgi:hypothetical protein
MAKAKARKRETNRAVRVCSVSRIPEARALARALSGGIVTREQIEKTRAAAEAEYRRLHRLWMEAEAGADQRTLTDRSVASWSVVEVLDELLAVL